MCPAVEQCLASEVSHQAPWQTKPTSLQATGRCIVWQGECHTQHRSRLMEPTLQELVRGQQDRPLSDTPRSEHDRRTQLQGIVTW